FILPAQPGAPPPPPSKMAVLTWAAIFPLITLVVLASAPLIGSWPLVPRLAVTTLVTVPVMTWVVMDDIASDLAQLRARGVHILDLPELGTMDGIADIGFALAAWFTDPHHNTLSLLQLK